MVHINLKSDKFGKWATALLFGFQNIVHCTVLSSIQQATLHDRPEYVVVHYCLITFEILGHVHEIQEETLLVPEQVYEKVF